MRTHRNTLVNPAHVREVRRRSQGEDWELQLDPPVNLVLPVSRDALPRCGRRSGRIDRRRPPRRGARDAADAEGRGVTAESEGPADYGADWERAARRGRLSSGPSRNGTGE